MRQPTLLTAASANSMRSLDEKRITVFSTIPRVEDIELPPWMNHVSIIDASHNEVAKAYVSNRRQRRCFVFNGLSRKVWMLALLETLLPNRNRYLVVVDMILTVPTTLRERCVAFLRSLLLARVDLFITYARNTERLREIYHLSASRFEHVPFKVNDREMVMNMESRDEGYIVVAGQTRRDFATFHRAIEGLSMPVRIVARGQEVLSKHGSILDSQGWSEHVALVRDAATTEAFLTEIARARLVVLPILEKNITPSGVGICLAAMALGKCVVISEGPAADGLVDEGQALVVQAGDWVALRDAIVTAWADPELRAATARRGFDYAMSLGDERRLHRDTFEAIANLCAGGIG